MYFELKVLFAGESLGLYIFSLIIQKLKRKSVKAKLIDCEHKYLTNMGGFNSKDSQWRGRMDC